MKFTKNILAVAGLLIATMTCQAQRSFDMFNVPKTIVLAAPQNFTVNGGVGLITNGPVDIRMFDGLACIDIFSTTNTGTTGGTLTATVETSPDNTTWTALTNYALISSTTSILYTNSANTNTVATDVFLIPGTYTNYSVTANLSAGTVLQSLPYTNGGAVTITTKGYYKLGWSIGDGGRYAHIVWTAGGTTTNFTAGATITAVNEGPLK